MALLSATQGTPERLWAIVSIVAAHGGSVPRNELQAWLKPNFEDNSDQTRGDKDRSLVDQAIQAASGLGLVEANRDIVSLLISPLPSDIHGFADSVHQILLSQPSTSADADILDAYACAVVQTEKLGNRQWLSEWSAVQISDMLSRSMTPRNVDSDDLRFNKSRPPPWTRWLEFIGLNEKLSAQKSLLSVTTRLHRELTRSDLPRGEPIEAVTVLDWVAEQLPYLDNGTLFLSASKRMEHGNSSTLSRLLSAALRDLHEDGLILLVTPRGDAQAGVRLVADNFASVAGFNAIVLNEGLAHD